MTYCSKCGKTAGELAGLTGVNICSECIEEINIRNYNLVSAIYQNYQSTDTKRLPQKALHEAMKWTYGTKGLLIQGASGSGKTRIFWQVLKKAITEHFKPCTVHVFDCVSFGHELATAYKNYEGEEWLAKVANADIVAFDDIGKEKLTERVEAELFGVIEKRMARMKPIIATSEESGSGLASRISTHRGPALIRRLREMCEVITVK